MSYRAFLKKYIFVYNWMKEFYHFHIPYLMLSDFLYFLNLYYTMKFLALKIIQVQFGTGLYYNLQLISNSKNKNSIVNMQ